MPWDPRLRGDDHYRMVASFQKSSLREHDTITYLICKAQFNPIYEEDDTNCRRPPSMKNIYHEGTKHTKFFSSFLPFFVVII